MTVPSKRNSHEVFPKTKVGILYYSGAGNTEYLAHIFRDVFLKRLDCEVVFFERIKRNIDIPSLEEFDILGIGFPIYFRRTPSIVFDVIDQIEGKGKKIFTFCTKGMYSGNVSREVLLRCAASRLSPAGHFEAFMPGTDALLLFARKGSISEKIIRKMRSRHLTWKVSRFAQTVLQTQGIPIPRPKWYTLFDTKVIKPLERLITRDYQALRGGYRILEDRCTACMICVNDCPEGNIEFRDGVVVFDNRCDLCLRCIHHCPTEAIQIGTKTLKTVRYWPTVSESSEIVIKEYQP